MDNLFFYLNLSALICGVLSLVYGVVQMLKRKQGTYYNVAILAFSTLTLGFLFCCLFVICGGKSSGFSLGYLAMIGAFLFFLTSNRSYISILEDAPTKYKKRATVLAYIFPLILVAIFMMIIFKVGLVLSVIPPLGLCVATGFCSYFSFRQVLIPDIKRGFIDCMRPYNISLCVLSVCCMLMELFYVYNLSELAFIILCVVSDVTIVLLMLFLVLGVKKWRT